MNFLKYASLFGLLFLVAACSDLEEQLNDSIPSTESESVDVQQLLNGAYADLRALQDQTSLLSVTQHSSDELAGPTRGRDWDDAGRWRVFHTHTWTPSNVLIGQVWRELNRNAFNAQQVLCNGATGQVAAEATFLRTFNDFLILDLYGQVPRRACFEDLLQPPSGLLSRAAAIDVFISELEGVVGSLPTDATAARATQNAARALLAKMYLNRAVYLATDADGGAQEGPYNFEQADMQSVVNLVNDIDGTGQVRLDDNYYDNFSPNNGTASSELLFVSENTRTGASGNLGSRWRMTTHYNQSPDGWNGFVALSDLYDRFEPNDSRLTAPIDADNVSFEAGFLIGQQFDTEGNPLEDRIGNPLAFTPEFTLIEGGDDFEVAGIRAIKYPVDPASGGGEADNDYVFLRYADVFLMKAEAMFRMGNNADALSMVNELRTLRGASALSSLSEQDLLDERSRELWWEGWRRNDQIRFNAFLGTWQEKPNASEAARLLFPFPNEAISTNPNLQQNPGY